MYYVYISITIRVYLLIFEEAWLLWERPPYRLQGLWCPSAGSRVIVKPRHPELQLQGLHLRRRQRLRACARRTCPRLLGLHGRGGRHRRLPPPLGLFCDGVQALRQGLVLLILIFNYTHLTIEIVNLKDYRNYQCRSSTR